MGTSRVDEVEQEALELWRQGRHVAAYDLASRALAASPGDPRLALAKARAAAKIGAASEAIVLLTEARPSLPSSEPALLEEALGLLARLHKEAWLVSGDPADARGARDLYAEAFAGTRGHWTGINAATMSWLLGDRDGAARLAAEVLAITGDATDYWALASRGEAFVLLDRRDDARRVLEAASSIGRAAMRASTREQLGLLVRQGNEAAAEVRDHVRAPSIVVFSGHMVDRPGRGAPRFPNELAPRVAEAVARLLDGIGADLAFGSAACGSDLLFVEAMKHRGGTVHLVLPFRAAEFLETSVRYAGDAWVARFHEALRGADAVTHATEESYLTDGELFRLANRVARGLAEVHGRLLGAAPRFAVVLDPSSGGRVGSTLDALREYPPERVERIDLASLRDVRSGASSAPAGGAALPSATSGAAERPPRVVRSLLFADIVGYSRLEEEEAPYFVHRVLRSIADALGDLGVEPRCVNTWGDGIYAVHDRAADMARYALRLRDAVRERAWGEVPRDLHIRIAVHAGPVFEAVDPLTGRVNYFGAHVNRTARLEPVTPPDRVYASETFVALLLCEDPGFELAYAGVHQLAKRFGELRVYELCGERPGGPG